MAEAEVSPTPWTDTSGGLTPGQIGGIVGGVVGLFVILGFVFFWRIRGCMLGHPAITEDLIPNNGHDPRYALTYSGTRHEAPGPELSGNQMVEPHHSSYWSITATLSYSGIRNEASALGGFAGHNVYAESGPSTRPQPRQELGDQETEQGRSADVSHAELPSPNARESREQTAASSHLDSDSLSSGSHSGSSVVPHAIDLSQQRAVDTLMAIVRPLVSRNLYVGIKIKAGAGSPPGSLFQAGNQSEGSSGELSGSTKRNVPDDSDTNSSLIPERNRDTKRPRQNAVRDSQLNQKLACPFYKHNPRRHLKHRSCGGPGWDSTHRIKEHIYRNHKLPIHCSRCGATMRSSAELVTHNRQAVACQLQPIRLPDGIGDAQEGLLRKRYRGGSEEEKWLEIYKILFPDEEDDLIPSPYYETYGDTQEETVLRYERVQRRELLRVVRKLLEEEVLGLAGPLEDQLRNRLEAIIRQAQVEVFRSHRGVTNIANVKDNPELEGKQTNLLSAENEDPKQDSVGSSASKFPISVSDSNSAVARSPRQNIAAHTRQSQSHEDNEMFNGSVPEVDLSFMQEAMSFSFHQPETLQDERPIQELQGHRDEDYAPRAAAIPYTRITQAASLETSPNVHQGLQEGCIQNPYIERHELDLSSVPDRPDGETFLFPSDYTHVEGVSPQAGGLSDASKWWEGDQTGGWAVPG